MICIRRALYEDIPNIMQFMDEHWKPGNILARNRDFFEWQFLDGDKVNMFLGIDDECGKIYGMIGAVVYSKSPHPDISGCAWKTIRSGNPMLGMELSDYMIEELQPRCAYSAGLSDKAIRINEMRGGIPVAMDHYYRLADREQYEIAEVNNKVIPIIKDTGYDLKLINSVEEMKQIITDDMLAQQMLSKDYRYIEKRYFLHPVYHYDIWKIVNQNGDASSVLIMREERENGGGIGKIVDFYGQETDLGKITAALDRLMKERDYEFVDVYSYGIPTNIYEQAGFSCCDDECANIIPNYFHPFEKRNITLKMIKPVFDGIRLFRGDGDQDRPC